MSDPAALHRGKHRGCYTASHAPSPSAPLDHLAAAAAGRAPSVALAGGERHRIEPLLSLTLNEFSFDSDPVYGDNDLPAAPGYAARGELMYRNASGFYAGPTFDLVGRRYADFANTYRVGSHELLGLRGGYQAGNWEVFGELRNLLDEDYIATVGVLNVASADARVLYPGAPLSAYVGIRMTF